MLVSASQPRDQCSCGGRHTCRRLFSEKVAAENLRIYNRLQQVKPSKDTAAAQLRKEWAAAQKYSRNCNKRGSNGKSPPRGRRAPAAQSYAEVSMDHTAAESAPVLHVTVPSTVHESTTEAPAVLQTSEECTSALRDAMAESHPIDVEA